VLSQFDTQADEFSPQRVQDELIGQMSELLGIDYDVLALDLTESESRQRALVSDPTPPRRRRRCLRPPPARRPPGAASSIAACSGGQSSTRQPSGASPPREDTARERQRKPRGRTGDLLLEHIVSPAPTTERLQSIQRMVADQLGDALPPDFSASVLQSIPVQAGGLYPISDVWYIDAGLDTPDRLRIHIAQFAREIAEAALDECIEDRSDGIGFACRARPCTIAARPCGAALLAWPVSSPPTRAGWRAARHRPAGAAARPGRRRPGA
jgi:hypothetical protein